MEVGELTFWRERNLCSACVSFVDFCFAQNSEEGYPKFIFFKLPLPHPLQWRYCIRLENLDSDVVQLRERHWRIFSLSGTLETVRGRGVVGRVSIPGLVILVLCSKPGGLVQGFLLLCGYRQRLTL